MITITRRRARCLRGVLRRAALGLAHRGPVPPLVLRAEGGRLRAQYRYAGLAVAHDGPGASLAREALALPLEALADLEGGDGTPVALEASAPGRVVARWEDRGIPRSRAYEVTPVDGLAPFPEPPGSWSDAPGALLDALAEASLVAADETTRYALDCLQLRGGTGKVVATDGRQLLIQGGFSFPWPGDVLVRRSPVFARRELPRDRPVSVGRTDAYVVLRAGDWTLWLEIQSDARFPDVSRVLPDAGAAATRLAIDPADAAFLLDALGRLPGGDEPDAPATVDLNGRVALRVRDPDSGRLTELALARSGYDGAPIRLHTNRSYLGRALRLGFAALEATDPDAPLVCRAGDRTFAWQPLSQGSALAPAEDAIRIESSPPGSRPAEHPGAPPRGDAPMSRRNEPTPAPGDGTPQEPPANGEGAGGLSGLIREAEALHESLGDARARAGRLVVALRKQRRRERLVQSTLASLRQLKLPEAVG